MKFIVKNVNIPLVSVKWCAYLKSVRPTSQQNSLNQDEYILYFACILYSRTIIFMKRFINKLLWVTYIQFQYIERIILAIKIAKKSKLHIKNNMISLFIEEMVGITTFRILFPMHTWSLM